MARIIEMNLGNFKILFFLIVITLTKFSIPRLIVLNSNNKLIDSFVPIFE